MGSPATLSLDEQAAALLRLGVPESRIRATLGLPATAPEPHAAAPTVVLPVTLVVPWTLLVSDDERFGKPQVRRTKAGNHVAQNTLSKRYRLAKWELKRRFRTQLGPTLAYSGPGHDLKPDEDSGFIDRRLSRQQADCLASLLDRIAALLPPQTTHDSPG